MSVREELASSLNRHAISDPPSSVDGSVQHALSKIDLLVIVCSFVCLSVCLSAR